MKPVYTLFIALFVLWGCKKQEVQPAGVDFLQSIKASLKDSMTASDYAQLDFARCVLNEVDSVGLYFLRVPFKDKPLSRDFLLVQTSRSGKIINGRIVHMEGEAIKSVKGDENPMGWEGSVLIRSLDGKPVFHSPVHKGYITAFHSAKNLRGGETAIYPAPDLPEVVVVAYVRRDSGIDYSTWLWLNSFARNMTGFYAGDSGSGGYYGSLDGGGYSGGGGGYAGAGGGGYGSIGTKDETIFIDADTYADKDAIDIENYVKCFDKVSDAGAQCEITLYADIPVDSDPNKLFDFSTGSPGHTFIGLKKSNGGQSVHQYLGFYPRAGWKSAITNAPMEAKFVDDSQHEYNASYSKTLTALELRSVLTEIRYLKNARYDIDDFNCTDWALDVFNKQGYGLSIPLYDIPGNLPTAGTSTPQGVYNKLKEMKNAGAAHSDRIAIGFLKGYAANSSGPCN